jgi:hypothetical protein
MVQPFYKLPPEKPSFFQRLLGRHPRRNAYIELVNALAAAPTIEKISAAFVGGLNARYRLNLTRDYKHDVEALFEKYLRHSLEDKAFSQEELNDLKHLKLLFGLTDNEAEALRRRAVEQVYGSAVGTAIGDHRLSEAERAYLEALQNDLLLPAEVAQRIYRDQAEQKMQNYFKGATSDARLSPDEESELEAIASSLGVTVAHDPKSLALYHRLRLYWLIENGEVPTIPVDIRLQKNEACYAEERVDWYENRTVTRRVRYAGVGGRVRIAKGIYLRLGEVAVQPVQEDILKHIDSGTVFLTNKRLIFMGVRKNTTIQLKKVLDFVPYSNGIEIEKETGKSPFLQFSNELDLFALKLDRALRDAYA